MRYSEKGRIKAAIVGDVITIARGEAAIIIPKLELSDLLAAVKGLVEEEAPPPTTKDMVEAPATEPLASAPPPPEPVPEQEPNPEPVAEEAPADPPEAPAAPPETAEEPAPPKKPKKGQLWATIQDFLAAKKRAQGFAAILQHLKATDYPGSPEQGLRIVLGKKASSGALEVTESGRYKLADVSKAVEAEASADKPTPEPAPISEPEAVVAPAEAPAPLPIEEPAPRTKPKTVRLWDIVQDFLAGKDRAQGFAAILQHVEASDYPGHPEQGVRIVLGKRASSGELEVTESGLYGLAATNEAAEIEAPAALVEEPEQPVVAAVPEPEPEPVPLPPKTRKGRPGGLWKAMSSYLAEHPRGVKVEKLVSLAGERGWTAASNVEHAVKASLTRVGTGRVTVSEKGVAKLVKR